MRLKLGVATAGMGAVFVLLGGIFSAPHASGSVAFAGAAVRGGRD